MSSNQSFDIAKTRKKPYAKPRIEDYGTVVRLTGTGGEATLVDGPGPFDFGSGAGG